MRLRGFAIVPIIALVFFTTACAGTLRDNVRKGALIAGEAALSIDADEATLYASTPRTIYTPEQHAKAGTAIVVMLKAVQVYERAARAWPEKVAIPGNVPEAMAEALSAITAVEQIIGGVPGNSKLLANLEHVRSVIGGGAK